MNESIEAEEDSDRVPKSENTKVENLKKEVKKLKIENNRSEVEPNILYGDNSSRREKWNNQSDYRGKAHVIVQPPCRDEVNLYESCLLCAGLYSLYIHIVILLSTNITSPN